MLCPVFILNAVEFGFGADLYFDRNNLIGGKNGFYIVGSARDIKYNPRFFHKIYREVPDSSLMYKELPVTTFTFKEARDL